MSRNTLNTSRSKSLWAVTVATKYKRSNLERVYKGKWAAFQLLPGLLFQREVQREVQLTVLFIYNRGNGYPHTHFLLSSHPLHTGSHKSHTGRLRTSKKIIEHKHMKQGTLSYLMEWFYSIIHHCLIFNFCSNKIILCDVLAWQKIRRSRKDARTAGAYQGCRKPTRFERVIVQQEEGSWRHGNVIIMPRIDEVGSLSKT